MVSEITGNYGLLLPTLWVCSLCFILSDDRTIYSSQVEKRSLSPAHQGDYVREVLGICACGSSSARRVPDAAPGRQPGRQ